MKILLTNDDGTDAPGLLAVKKELENLGDVVVVAPYEERSGVSHGVTIHYPIRVIEVGRDHYALTGTPADCVIFAVRKLLPELPDLVVSGINRGANLGDDILYSGTVAGAREAALQRVPALAVSLVTHKEDPDFGPAAAFTCRLIRTVFPDMIPPGGFLNINIPTGQPTEYRFTRQGSKMTASSIEEKSDPRGRKYFWIGRDESEWLIEADTDYQAIRDEVVSITPLHRDQTDYRSLRGYTQAESVTRLLE
jgi:5'-nucleotidase